MEHLAILLEKIVIFENNSYENEQEKFITLQTDEEGLHEIKAGVLNQTQDNVYKHRKDISTRLANNDLVMRHIFGFLDVKALKQCRSACKSWKEICLAEFRKRVKIKLAYYCEDKYVKDLTNVFPFGTYPTCTSFKLDGLYVSHTTAFCRFLESNFDFVTWLEIGPILVFNKKGKLDEFSANELIGPKVKTLSITRGYTYSGIKISIEKLVAVEYLRLNGIQLVLTKGISISPKEIDFKSLKFISQEGERINKVCVNDFVEFSKISKIALNGYNYNNGEEISIRLPGFLKLNTFKLVGVDKVTCVLSQMPEIKNVHFKHVGLISKSLTKAVETIKMPDLVLSQEGKLDLPNLKYLTSHSISDLSVFSNCNNLVGVYLKPEQKEQCNLSWFPPSVKKLKLKNVTVVGEKFVGHLESLHLFGYAWISVYQTLAKFNTKNLYISLNKDIETLSVKNSLAITYLLRQRITIFAVGKLQWLNEEHFNKGLLKYYVDKFADCYIFQRKYENAEMSGKRIDIIEFGKLMKAFM